ncbi:PIN domain nuclease [Mycolicibacter sp. MYC123]|uniref:Ribonuclease VapC n=1 Tax=[Mycobacterium] zoologicum TaxID=2872311 RepID=A0ABU5YHD8_9MYCO|nr:PIN domain nuclease [Mycolicibacter sp. MYC123]MEB3049225.1 PIN domain nuclease [Mycolicibacter sp. MYC123]
MGLRAHFLGDTSAVARVTKPTVAQRLLPLMEAGLVARCTVTDLEAGVSARNGLDWKRTRQARSLWPQATIDQAVMDRAFEVQGVLAAEGLHRAVKLGDLLIAAAAERARLVVLHYDRDFDRIAAVTGQPTEWVAPPGTVD